MDITDTSQSYMRRVKIIDTPYFGIYIHRIYRPDGIGYPMHDHPWDFWSFIINGGYDEDLGHIFMGNHDLVFNHTWRKSRKRFSFHRMRNRQIHKITNLHKVPTTTLVFRGRIRKEWGFYTPEGFVPSGQYFEDNWPDH